MTIRLLESVRTLPRVFHLEDRIYGGLFERDLKAARKLAAVPSPLNCALRSVEEIREAEQLLAKLHLRYRYDHPFKVWDGARMLSYLLHHTQPSAAVIDFGSGPHSNVLRWLELYGYRDLRGVDLIFNRSKRRGAIRYFGDDIHRTRFEDRSFECAIAQSVIEHNVRIPVFLEEAKRILKPGGHLLVSTDFWPEKVDTTGVPMYGAKWNIFSRSELVSAVEEAERIGFHFQDGSLDLSVGDPVVQVLGKEYTFAFIALRSEG